MNGADIGRVLVASLHAAIADELTSRADFYDHWLGGERLRDGSVGLAPMSAVLGFLRAEGEPYHAVMRRAGAYAADWSVDSLPAMRRRAMLLLPRWWRVRRVLKLIARAIRRSYEPTKVVVRFRRGVARFAMTDSLFCRVREKQATPQCDFYAALIVRILMRFNLPSTFQIEQCAGTEGGPCILIITLASTAAQTDTGTTV